MTAIIANGITLEYEDAGDPAAQPILLIMGLGAQLTLWPDELIDALVARGFRVIRFDNRDVGLSTKFDRAGLPDLAQLMMAMMSGRGFAPPYTLSDMAADAVGLLDALGVPSAHIVGASMGGMIAQLVAADHPTRVRSLTSIMSTSGNPSLPPARPEAMAVLTGRPMSADRETIVAHGMRTAQVIGSPAYPYDLDRLRTRVERDIDRSFAPAGAMRQMSAILADGDRRERLRRITAPTTIIHGDADPLVPVEGGRDTAAAIPGAELVILPGMGHDLPLPLIDDIADAIAATAARGR
ncbi:alpha/beta fold hydrolase [Sphingomonas floccifaciens]|uniref:Alpha/beta fold hydrolase n=1 Tax=Sphingomonas floccifaciens TaxID=1844115 RepID=A0ABW4NBC5_9SPHN